MSHILLISIGPVQTFIASARRSRDLWYGSWLLSELSKAVANSIAQSEAKKENALVFPGVNDASDLAPNTALNVANKIVAIVTEPKKRAAGAEHAMRERLKALQNEALKEIDFQHKHIKTNLVNLDNQIEEMPEFYWVAVPFDGENYADTLAEAERLMAARKSLRDFERVPWGDNVPKSSISGVLESVIDEHAYPNYRKDSPNEIKDKVQFLYDHFKVKGAERVSGVDLLKRHGNREGQRKQPYFPSTSHFAAHPFLNALHAYKDDTDMQKAWQAYSKELGALANYEKTLNDEPIIGNYDASLLYEGRLHELLDGQSDTKKETSHRLLSELHQTLKQENVPALQPYYALMLGDGDSIGKALGKIQSYELHQKFSVELDDFSRGVGEIINKHGGRLIYAGGDDVLAFLPVDTALARTVEIAQNFRDRMITFFSGKQDEYGKPIAPPTFSAGIAIVHHLEPLSDALELARRTEKDAKSITGKDAVAIAVDKRSGVTRTIKGKWSKSGFGLGERLPQLIEHFRNGDIPKNTAFHIQDSVQKLGGWEQFDAAVTDNGDSYDPETTKRVFSEGELTDEDQKIKQVLNRRVFNDEVKRILRRRGISDKVNDESSEEEKKMGKLFDLICEAELQVIDELIIAGFLSSLYPPKTERVSE